MAGLSKAKYLISEPCPIWIRNDKISHNSIVVLFVILSYWYWQYLCLFCVSRAKAISMDNVYAEAKALLNMGFRYWFDDDEIAELYRESEDFQVQTAEMELLLRCFEKPTEDESYSLMTTTEILTYLGIYTHQPLVAKRMGEALKKAEYIKVSKRRNGGSPIYVYKIRKILPCPILQTCSSQM